MRNVLAVIAGVITGGVITMIAEAISHQLYPPPVLVEFDLTPLKEFLNSLPPEAWAILIFGWLLAAFGAGLVSALIAKANWKRASLITGGILLAFSIVNFITIPHPIWVMAITALVYLPAAYSGGKLVAKKA